MTAGDETSIEQIIANDMSQSEISDLYQLTRLVEEGRVDHLTDIIHALREDADCLEKAQWKVEENEWSTEEAVRYIAETSQLVAYDITTDSTEV